MNAEQKKSALMNLEGWKDCQTTDQFKAIRIDERVYGTLSQEPEWRNRMNELELGSWLIETTEPGDGKVSYKVLRNDQFAKVFSYL